MEPFAGRVTADATVKTFDSGKQVVNFTVAENRTYVKDGERKTRTRFVECSLWRRIGLAPYLKKGTVVKLDGDFGARAYNNMNGEAVAVLTMNVREIYPLSSNKKAEQAAANVPASKESKKEGDKAEPDDDLPF